MPEIKITKLSGRVVRRGVEVITLFKVSGKYYPATDYNIELMEAYIHTGDEQYLTNLEKEMEL